MAKHCDVMRWVGGGGRGGKGAGGRGARERERQRRGGEGEESVKGRELCGETCGN